MKTRPSPLSRPTEGILRRQLAQMEEEFADDEAVTHSSRLFRELTAEERELLQEMRQWADGASKRPDAKARELLNWIHTYIQPNGVV